MKFVSIRNKLIKAVSIIFVLSFVLVMAIVGYINWTDSQKSLVKSEASIRNSLIAKGRTLVSNNSQALKGMVEDNAFSAVKELVSSTVRDDEDIVYGIFMDVDMLPWVHANPDNQTGDVAPGEEMEDDASQWASKIEQLEYKIFTTEKGSEVYEFAAPVIIEDEIMGFIRYGISTDSMRASLKEAEAAAARSLRNTLMILFGTIVAALTVGVLSTRKVAGTMTTPLNSLQQAAGTIASGNYDQAVTVKTNDEIGLLANNFEQMRTTIQKKMEDLAKLNSTGEVLASILEQAKALEVVLQAMHEQIGVQIGSVYLMNDNDELEVKAYFPPKKMQEDAKPITFASGQGVLGKAAKDKEIIFVEDTSKDDMFTGGESRSPRSLLCVPLLDKDILIGVMNLSGEVGTVHFEDSDYEFVSSIARLLVITIKNIRMLEVIEEQNRTLEQKVAERTAELAQKNNDINSMMSNMHQGLFTIMEGGVVHHEYAKYLETILGTGKIASRNFMDLLFSNTDLGSDTIDQVKTAVEALIGSDEMMFDFNSHLLVTEYNFVDKEGNEKILELDWDPIVFNDEIEKIMVTVRDVTELKALEKAAEAQKQELEIIGHILAVGQDKFSEFLSSAYDFINKCRTTIEATNEKDLEVVASLFRWMHTIKGNARTYGFSYVTNSVHEVESTYDELRKNEAKVWEQAALLQELEQAETDIKRYETIAVEKLGIGSSGSEAGVSVNAEEVGELLERMANVDASGLDASIRGMLADSYKLLLSAQAQPIESVIDEVLESVSSLADELDKPKPAINIDNGGVFIEGHAHSMMNNIFMHVMRNAVDHGIEGAEEREQKGKPRAGTINLHVTNTGDTAEFMVADDGRGLALSKIFEKAVDAGMYESGNRPDDAEVANLIFASGFSTAEQVSEVSGRGVGMDAVKKFLEQEGGGIRIELTDSEDGADFRQFKTVISLPKAFYKLAPDWVNSD